MRKSEHRRKHRDATSSGDARFPVAAATERTRGLEKIDGNRSGIKEPSAVVVVGSRGDSC